jgi:hypothetical protein
MERPGVYCDQAMIATLCDELEAITEDFAPNLI